ncbi:zinc-binding dehydrogenase [Shigella flexneri]
MRTIGLLAIQCAVALGAKSVTAIDISSEKRHWQIFGAMQTFNSSEMSAPQCRAFYANCALIQLILETAGVPQTVELAVEIAGPHAQLALVGTLHQDLHLTSATFGEILRKELTVIGSWMNYSSPWPGREWETASRLLTERKLSLEPLMLTVEALKASPRRCVTSLVMLCRAKCYSFPETAGQRDAGPVLCKQIIHQWSPFVYTSHN